MSFACRILQTPGDRVLGHKALAKAAPLCRRQPKNEARSRLIPPEKWAAEKFRGLPATLVRYSLKVYSAHLLQGNAHKAWSRRLGAGSLASASGQVEISGHMIFVNLDRHFVTLLSTSCNVSFAISASRLSLRAPSTAGIDPPHGSGICEIHHSDRRTPCGIQLAAPPD